MKSNKWSTYVLISKWTNTTWFNMNVDFHVIEEERKQNTENVLIQKWTYVRDDDGDKLIEKEDVNSFGIDVQSDCKGMIISRLGNYVTTVDISDGGSYNMDKTYSQVWIKTTLTLEQLETLLYKMSFPRECEIVGAFLKEW